MNEPDGQLMPAEREFLYNAVKEAKPSIVLEVGTWHGGGSTLQIFNAMYENEHGFFYTCEPDTQCYRHASDYYRMHLFVSCFNLTGAKMIDLMILSQSIPDFLFFDGPEDDHTALEDLLKLEEHLEAGTIFMMHDFDPPSIKAENIRPYLETSDRWELVAKLTAPESVGICKFRMIK